MKKVKRFFLSGSRRYFSFLILSLFLSPSPSLYATSPAWGHKLTIVISGLKNTEGDVKISIQNKPELFNTKEGIEDGKNRILNISNGTVQYDFNKLAPGRYAIAVFHDQNKNDKLDLDLFDTPTEGFGFSNNPDIKKKAPQFKEAAFDFKGDNTVTIKLIYP